MKRINSLLLILMFIASAVSAQISNAWTSTLTSTQVPPSATIPTVAALNDAVQNRENFSFNLDAVTYDNATETTAWTAIGAATKTYIDSNYVVEIFGLNPALDITMRTVITSVQRRFDNFELGDLQQQYTAATDVFRIVGYCEWEIDAP